LTTSVEITGALRSELRAGILEDLPEFALIENEALREQATNAWTLALAESSFRRVRDMPGEAVPGKLILKRGGQDLHLRGVTRLALSYSEDFLRTFPEARVDRDVLVAGGLCHDIGKTFECDPVNLQRWAADASLVGRPSLRHPIYGAHIGLLAGLPESVAHIAACHSAEGDNVQRSVECTLVREADAAWWRVATALGLVRPDSVLEDFNRMFAQRGLREGQR
jgi:23S rRNA maturation-related 3'-5' exoribonuclease YhaM